MYAAPPTRVMENTLAVSSDDWLEDCFEGSVPTTATAGMIQAVCISMREQQQMTVGRTKVEDKRSSESPRIASKPHSTPLTLKWLEDNYEIAEGVCIPRSTLYMHYLDYCGKNDTQPVNAASFGKIIRQQFPQITTRRLGTRGQSKYHYYGIGVKETSLYFDIIYSRKGVQSVNDGKKDIVKQVASYSPRSKLGTLLPDFPTVFDLILPPNVTAEKVTTFLMMYRTHCQRLLDTVIRANFDEVQGFLLHFWQGMPQHIVPILGTSIVVDLVGVCDSILYKAISSVLMPSVLHPLPDSLTQVIRKFARQLDDWLKMALEDLPDTLRQMKIDMARRFGQLLKRQTSLNHLCQASRTVIHNAEITNQMLRDWNHVDLASICKQTLYTMDKFSEKDHDMIATLCREFEDLLQDQSPLESYTRWLDAMVERCVVQPAASKPESMRRIARQFLLMWSCFGTRIIRDMTLQSAPSFGSFHLLHLMFDDYVLFMVESLHCQERSNELLRSITGQPKPVDYEDDVILPKPSLFPASTIVASSPTGTGSAGPTHAHYVQERQSVITDGREAFASTHSCGGGIIHSQPATPSIRPSVPSPSRSSSMTSYDTRPTDIETRHHVSPHYVTDAPINLQLTTHTITDGYDRYGVSSRGHHSSTDLNPYPYTYVNSTPYGGYRSRDYSSSNSSNSAAAIATTAEWMDNCVQQRYNAQRNLSTASQDYQSAYYTSYGYNRTPSDYEVAMYGYTGSLPGTVMRTNEADGGGSTYQQSVVDSSSVLYQAEDAELVGKGKRKVLDIMNAERSCVKRRYANEYAGYEQTAAFHNSTGLHQT